MIAANLRTWRVLLAVAITVGAVAVGSLSWSERSLYPDTGSGPSIATAHTVASEAAIMPRPVNVGFRNTSDQRGLRPGSPIAIELSLAAGLVGIAHRQRPTRLSGPRRFRILLWSGLLRHRGPPHPHLA